jgi:hypothetical protein
MAPVEKKALPVEEDDDEIEEGEIVEDDDASEFEDDDASEFEDDDEEEVVEEVFDDDDDVPGLGDIADMAASLFATPDGDTVASALVGIREQLETQNRILIKILTTLKD